MPNDYFQFKQFRIDQGNCGMKITTDACIFGAFVGSHFKKENKNIQKKILDIGTGTGLLALMMSQFFSSSQTDAVELDRGAFNQSRLNFQSSKWNKNIKSIHSSIQDFSGKSSESYDLIISNPPFFINSFKPPSSKRSLARHTDTLTYNELLSIGEKLLSNSGIFYLLLPKIESNYLINEIKKTKINLIDCVDVFPNPNKPAKRSILILSKEHFRSNSSNIYIKDEGNTYTKETVELLRDFYLYL